MKAEPLLAVRDVTKTFGTVRAVDRLSVSVAPGEIVAVLGPNGAGKTTLIRMIIGILRPDFGTIRFSLDGTSKDGLDPRRLGYLPEERGMYQDVSVERVLVYHAALRGMKRGAAREAAARWLEALGLADRASEPLKALSKGNQQKVQFISAVVHSPDLVILDEPFSGLDPVNQDVFIGLIRRLRDDGATVLFSAHQMQLVERLADRVVILRDGRAVKDGTVDAIRRDWTTGRLVRLTLGGGGDPSFLRALPNVLEVHVLEDAIAEVRVNSGAPLGPLLAAAGSRLELLDVQVQDLTLHDIYVRTVTGADSDLASTEVSI